ncbi:crustapain-like [Schistocerca gregaria]|uniref:crustapain-like n=1 Tax=Schistocerca gregaria TaxID=7010 RepID=UPI00211EC056|nr:crustapain-like [Schistocerca gregaria]
MARVSGATLALFLCLCLSVFGYINAKSFPVWPDNVSYRAEFDLTDWIVSMPIDVAISTDESGGRSTCYSFYNDTFYNGLNTYYRMSDNSTYFIYPKIDTPQCNYDASSDLALDYLPSAKYNWEHIKEEDGIDYWSSTIQVARDHFARFVFLSRASDNAPVLFQTDLYPIRVRYSNYTTGNISIPSLPSICDAGSRVRKNAPFPHITFLLKGLNQMLSAPPSLEVAQHHEFSMFILKYSKTYKDEEEYMKRLEIFKQNLEVINEHNRRVDSTYSLGVTKFSDLSGEEFRMLQSNNRLKESPRLKKEMIRKGVEVHKRSDSSALPASVDWTKKQGMVNSIKDQGLCGSCWAFGSISALESAWAIKTGNLYSLSEQQVIDCVWTSSFGCDGGLPTDAYDWILNHGISFESSQPYLMLDGFCEYRYDTQVKLKKYVLVSQDTSDIMDALANHGPVAAAMYAGDDKFRFYTGGIFESTSCNYCGPDDLDHEVLIVGYGTDISPYGVEMPYWLVRNSWGPHWGIEGYFKLARADDGKNSGCCINLDVLYPVV